MARSLSNDTEPKGWNWKKWLGVSLLVLISSCFLVVAWFVWQLRNYYPFSATIQQHFPTNNKV